MCNVDPVIESDSYILWGFRHGRMAVNSIFTEYALGDQSFANLIQLRLDLGLNAVDIEVLSARVTTLAGGDIRLKGVVSTLTHVAGHTGIFHHGGV